MSVHGNDWLNENQHVVQNVAQITVINSYNFH